jgi:hypothetical protein
MGQCLPSGNCNSGETEVNCDGPEDCPGEICCGTFSILDGYTVLECAATCDSQGEVIVCDPNGPPAQCPGQTNCESSTYLPAGYEVCK